MLLTVDSKHGNVIRLGCTEISGGVGGEAEHIKVTVGKLAYRIGGIASDLEIVASINALGGHKLCHTHTRGAG